MHSYFNMFKTKYYLKSKQGIILGVVKVNEEENVLNWNKVVDLLNSLTEENEQLQKENIFLAKQRNYWKGKCDVAIETFEIDEATAKKIMELEKENGQLQQLLAEYRRTNKHLSELCADASKNGYLPPLEGIYDE